MLNEPDVLLLLFLPFIYLFYTVELRRFLTDKNQDLSYCTGNSILKKSAYCASILADLSQGLNDKQQEECYFCLFTLF